MIAQRFVIRPEAGANVSARNILLLAARDEPSCLSATLTTHACDRVLACYQEEQEEWVSGEAQEQPLRVDRFVHLATILARTL
jgi:hypothetical protein